MIELHSWGTPNGRKISIMLEELDLPYEVYPVNIGKGDQFAPDFLKISPNNKIPAIIDTDTPDGPVSVFESGAILIYLAEKTGSSLLPASDPARAKVLEWLMFQMGSFGPFVGQMGHFAVFAPEEVPYGLKRYSDEAKRLLGVLDRQLAAHPYVAGGTYSIADIALYPWVIGIGWYKENAKRPIDIEIPANVAEWVKVIGARPAIERGMKVLA